MPSNASRPATFSVRGTNAPTPAASTMAPQSNCRPARVRTSKRPSSRRATWLTSWSRWNAGANGAICCEQPVGQLAAGARGQRGDVVDRLVAVELDALAAREGQGVDDVRGDLAQAQLEDLEQARPGRRR